MNICAFSICSNVLEYCKMGSGTVNKTNISMGSEDNETRDTLSTLKRSCEFNAENKYSGNEQSKSTKYKCFADCLETLSPQEKQIIQKSTWIENSHIFDVIFKSLFRGKLSLISLNGIKYISSLDIFIDSISSDWKIIEMVCFEIYVQFVINYNAIQHIADDIRLVNRFLRLLAIESVNSSRPTVAIAFSNTGAIDISKYGDLLRNIKIWGVFFFDTINFSNLLSNMCCLDVRGVILQNCYIDESLISIVSSMKNLQALHIGKICFVGHETIQTSFFKEIMSRRLKLISLPYKSSYKRLLALCLKTFNKIALSNDNAACGTETQTLVINWREFICKDVCCANNKYRVKTFENAVRKSLHSNGCSNTILYLATKINSTNSRFDFDCVYNDIPPNYYNINNTYDLEHFKESCKYSNINGIVFNCLTLERINLNLCHIDISCVTRMKIHGLHSYIFAVISGKKYNLEKLSIYNSESCYCKFYTEHTCLHALKIYQISYFLKTYVNYEMLQQLTLYEERGVDDNSDLMKSIKMFKHLIYLHINLNYGLSKLFIGKTKEYFLNGFSNLTRLELSILFSFRLEISSNIPKNFPENHTVYSLKLNIQFKNEIPGFGNAYKEYVDYIEKFISSLKELRLITFDFKNSDAETNNITVKSLISNCILNQKVVSLTLPNMTLSQSLIDNICKLANLRILNLHITNPLHEKFNFRDLPKLCILKFKRNTRSDS